MSDETFMPGVEQPSGVVVSGTGEVSSSSDHHAPEQSTVSWSTETRDASGENVHRRSYAEAAIRGRPPGIMFPSNGKGGKGGQIGGEGGLSRGIKQLAPIAPPKSHPPPRI